jgi:phosphoglycerate kinase
MQLKSVRDAEVIGKQVLLRVDFNVPMRDGVVVNDLRIKAALPTIQLLQERGAKVILATHLGRPEGKVVEELRVVPLQKKLEELGVVGVEMLENLRFDPREEQNDPALAEELASKADIFVNDAFGVAHRAHASTVGVAKLLPSYAGLLMEREVMELSRALTPPTGAVAIVGGAKLETKAPLIEKLANTYTRVLVGGAIANEYKSTRANVLLPIDGVRDATHVADIGSKTVSEWLGFISEASLVLWSGPLGIYEGGYTAGTDTVAHALASSNVPAVVGGGDTIAAVQKFDFNPKRIFISTGGGAMLEFLVKGTLPALEPLKK